MDLSEYYILLYLILDSGQISCPVFLSSSEMVFLCSKPNCYNRMAETDDSCCRQQEQKIPQQFRGHVQWPAVPGTTVADTILIHRNESVSYFLFFHTDNRKVAIERASEVVIRILKTRHTFCCHLCVNYRVSLSCMSTFWLYNVNCLVFKRLRRLITSYFERGGERLQLPFTSSSLYRCWCYLPSCRQCSSLSSKST